MSKVHMGLENFSNKLSTNYSIFVREGDPDQDLFIKFNNEVLNNKVVAKRLINLPTEERVTKLKYWLEILSSMKHLYDENCNLFVDVETVKNHFADIVDKEEKLTITESFDALTECLDIAYDECTTLPKDGPLCVIKSPKAILDHALKSKCVLLDEDSKESITPEQVEIIEKFENIYLSKSQVVKLIFRMGTQRERNIWGLIRILYCMVGCYDAKEDDLSKYMDHVNGSLGSRDLKYIPYMNQIFELYELHRDCDMESTQSGLAQPAFIQFGAYDSNKFHSQAAQIQVNPFPILQSRVPLMPISSNIQTTSLKRKISDSTSFNKRLLIDSTNPRAQSNTQLVLNFDRFSSVIYPVVQIEHMTAVEGATNTAMHTKSELLEGLRDALNEHEQSLRDLFKRSISQKKQLS
ncbi:uncharacterized protein KGF55_005802 [Candida pseudojiufengensis]|uniref:uncharacterized protein n=1 Tax=Candida pseudojiufengensis TaxID=497109 RepID=UPI0022251A99|nr:uncharacterized protein KGF55_005802 [Candida pseudojiufengensis]KAI5958459.1 hypothetical protein KGF55_005802 [Candida pseudojiufengensis]